MAKPNFNHPCRIKTHLLPGLLHIHFPFHSPEIIQGECPVRFRCVSFSHSFLCAILRFCHEHIPRGASSVLTIRMRCADAVCGGGALVHCWWPPAGSPSAWLPTVAAAVAIWYTVKNIYSYFCMLLL